MFMKDLIRSGLQSRKSVELKNSRGKGILLVLLTVIVMSSNLSYSQYLPVITNERGDTIHYTWPIPDSALCIKDEIIIRFKANALNLNKLCYNYQGPPTLGDPDLDYANIFKSELMSQEFPIDTLIADSSLRETIKHFGGTYLKRITAANPCKDTLSITRYGDTVKCENYLWMKLKLNNDTSMINACINLTLLYQYFLRFAEPNYCKYINRPDPVDNYYRGEIYPRNNEYYKQRNLNSFYTNVRRAWDFQVGNYNIKVGVIDDGIDYDHCDFGQEIGPGKKVAGGWNYFDNRGSFANNSPHGTPIAGIIGAFTNGPFGCSSSGGIAGIAGGWNTEYNNRGCALYGLKTGGGTGGQVNEFVISAVLEGAAEYEFGEIGSGFGLHVFNISSGDSLYSPGERAAYNFAFEQGVSIVCSRGNKGDKTPNYPACLEPTWVINVGGHNAGDPINNILPQRYSGTSYGLNMDLLAPAYNQDIISTSYRKNNSEIDYYERFGMTSAAAAHVTGVIALLRSEFYENPNHSVPPGIKPEPEDYENMLKAAALDLNYSPDNQNEELKTFVGYDNVSGWGQLKAGKLFEMLADGYVLKHYKITQFQPENSFQGISGGITIHESQGLRGDIEPGNYPVAEKRTLIGSITIEDNWVRNETNKLYVWGRNGRTTKGGLSQGNPLFPTSFTEVISGEGGNGIVPGIIHNNSLTVNAKTYQYRLNSGIIRPEDNNIELYISVFGKEIVPTGVDDNTKNSNSFIFPNPSKEFVTLKLNLENSCSPIIRIIDNLGVVLYEEKCDFMNSGNYDKIINTSGLISGIYYIEVYQNNKVVRNKLVIAK